MPSARAKDSIRNIIKTAYPKVFLVGYNEYEILGSKCRKTFKSVIMEFPSEWTYEGVCGEAF